MKERDLDLEGQNDWEYLAGTLEMAAAQHPPCDGGCGPSAHELCLGCRLAAAEKVLSFLITSIFTTSRVAALAGQPTAAPHAAPHLGSSVLVDREIHALSQLWLYKGDPTQPRKFLALLREAGYRWGPGEA